MMTGRWRALLLPPLLAAGLIAACVAPHSRQSTSSAAGGYDPVPVEDRTDIHGLLARLAHFARNPPATLTPAYRNASSRFERGGDASTRLELAWLISQPGTGFQDRARARTLLEDVLKAPGAGVSHVNLATLMLAELEQEDRRINALAKSRALVAESQKEKDALEVQIETLTRLLETLQQQFEELKAIERDVK